MFSNKFPIKIVVNLLKFDSNIETEREISIIQIKSLIN